MTIGATIKAARLAKGWSSCDRLAEEASALPGAPLITWAQVYALERSRNSFRIGDPAEPLLWVLKALGLGGEVIVQAMEQAMGKAA